MCRLLWYLLSISLPSSSLADLTNFHCFEECGIAKQRELLFLPKLAKLSSGFQINCGRVTSIHGVVPICLVHREVHRLDNFRFTVEGAKAWAWSESFKNYHNHLWKLFEYLDKKTERSHINMAPDPSETWNNWAFFLPSNLKTTVILSLRLGLRKMEVI